MARNITIWSPTYGDFVLNAAVLNEILGGAGGPIVQTSITTAGAGVLTAAALLGGQIARTGPVAAYTDTTDTASAIVTALGGFQAGETFVSRVKNATTFPQTLAGGAGVTVPSTVIVPPLSVGTYFGTVGGTAAAPTVALTHVDTNPINASAELANPQISALATVGAGTILTASVASGVTARGGTQVAAFTDTTDTAVALIAGISALKAPVGASVEYTYVNNTVFPATIAGGVGVTLSGITVVPANSWAKFLLTNTAAGAVSMVGFEQGYFPHSGSFVANQATPVTVADANVTANSNISFTLKTVGGTVGAYPTVKTITPQTGFTVAASASDTSTYVYEVRG